MRNDWPRLTQECRYRRVVNGSGDNMLLHDQVKKTEYRFSLKSREEKFNLFWEVMKPISGERVLNIGATPPHLGHAVTGSQNENCVEQPEQDRRWERLEVVGLNIDHSGNRQYMEFHQRADRMAVTADACRLPFADKSFDIVFSNAVIEHVPSAQQKSMASEIMRVGRSWFITTPNFWYPIELHHKVPLFQYFPRSLQRAIQVRFSTWPEWDTISLLSGSQFKRMFPGSKLRKVRVTFWPETLIVFHREAERHSKSCDEEAPNVKNSPDVFHAS
jgi:hypothetical protein